MSQDDIVDLLHESHENIRRFLSLGRRLAMSSIDETEVWALAGIIQRHSAIGLRLLIADEEALVPHLEGRSAELDRALATMRATHAEYEQHVRRLVALCRAIEREASPRAGRGQQLGETINAMAACLEPHLALMEREVFPALGALAQEHRDQMRAAMDARRDHAQRSDW